MRVLDYHSVRDRALAAHICELAHVDPSNVSAQGFIIHRNHVTYQEFQTHPNGRPKIRRDEFGRVEWVTKQRIIRNPLPKAAR